MDGAGDSSPHRIKIYMVTFNKCIVIMPKADETGMAYHLLINR